MQLLDESSMDRLLKSARARQPQRGLSLTKQGPWLKKAIPVRTAADWDDVRPGFLELDLVGRWRIHS